MEANALPKTDAAPGLQPRDTEEMLAVELSDDQLVTKNRAILSLMDDVDAKESETEAMKKRHQAEMAEVNGHVAQFKAQIKSLREQIKTGSAKVKVACKEIPNFDRGVIEVHRLDYAPNQEGRIIREIEMNLLEASGAVDEQLAMADAAAQETTGDGKKAKKGRGKLRAVEIKEID